MLIASSSYHPSLGGTVNKALLQQIRLINILYGIPFLAGGCRQSIQAHRPPSKLADHGVQHPPVCMIKTYLVHLQPLERSIRNSICNHTVTSNLGKIPYSFSNLLAIRGVPLERRAISQAPLSSIGICKISAALFTINTKSSGS